MFADIRTEWRVNDIENSLKGKTDRHELSTTNRNVDRLEYSLRELSAEIARLRSELQTTQNELDNIKNAAFN